MKTALITGITGQDGSYLAEFLLGKGYHVVGLVRESSTSSLERIAHLVDRVTLRRGDLLDQASLDAAIAETVPDEVYNFAAQSFVGVSWRQPVLTAEVNAVGVVRLLDAIRHHAPEARVYQAGSSEQFGLVAETPQRETTPFHPRSPYAVAKTYAHHAAVNYRESYGMFVCAGIAFNHESVRRSTDFVTRKVSDGVARIKAGHAKELRLGNLDACRDWGFAGDYVEGMWRMLQQDTPDDYVLATGVTHSVRELCRVAFEAVDLDWRAYVVEDPTLRRPAEVDHLIGDATKARTVLGWSPRVPFTQLIEGMVRADVEREARA